jgi:hypothetical protein
VIFPSPSESEPSNRLVPVGEGLVHKEELDLLVVFIVGVNSFDGGVRVMENGTGQASGYEGLGK